MRKSFVFSSIIIGIYLLLPNSAHAINPIIQSKFTADPAPMVHNDTVFLYTSHDEDDATGFKMQNWMLYTSTDMVNWTDHGIVVSLKNFEWVNTTNGAWAPQCIYRNGKFYLYCPMPGGVGIGVLISDSPYGPFKDPIGKPLIKNSNADIDPTVFIDDDGQAYMYWGNPAVYYVKLNEDMISYSGEIMKEITTPKNFQEGPWAYKRNGHYYLAYASTCCPEGIGYAMSKSPLGPWEFKGQIMDPDRRSSGNHPGIIDYKGSSYVFGFNYAINFSLTETHRERRSICVEKMTYNPDGTIQKLPWWTEAGAPQIGTFNPFIETEAETMAWEEGIETEKTGVKNVYVTDIDNGDYIKLIGVNFGENGAGVFSARVASALNGGKIELRLDSVKGTIIGQLPISNTGGWESWKMESTSIENAIGIHDLFLVFKGNPNEKLFNVDHWKFNEKKKKNGLIAINASIDKYKIDTVSGENSLPLSVQAIYANGTQKNIANDVSISANKKGIVKFDNGTVEAINYGLVNITVSYKGKTDMVSVLVKSYVDEHTVKRILTDKKDLVIFKYSKESLSITAEFVDGHTLDITKDVTYKSEDTLVLDVSKGVVKTKSKGETSIHISYTDQFANVTSSVVKVKVIDRDPYIMNKAADFTEQKGVREEISTDTGGGNIIGYIENGDWIKFGSVDFGDGSSSFQARVSSSSNGGNLEIHLDSLEGEVLGILSIEGTGGWQNWVTKSCPVNEINGVHDLYLKFSGERGYLCNLNWWMFEMK